MVLKAYVPDESRYLRMFAEQKGYGMPKYRGSPMTGGSFWGRVIGFAKGLFSKAAPYISNAVTQAQPHLKNLATKTIESTVDTAVEKINEKLKQQTGKGIKAKKGRKKRHDKIPDKL
jgi:hypothetical protein